MLSKDLQLVLIGQMFHVSSQIAPSGILRSVICLKNACSGHQVRRSRQLRTCSQQGGPLRYFSIFILFFAGHGRPTKRVTNGPKHGPHMASKWAPDKMDLGPGTGPTWTRDMPNLDQGHIQPGAGQPGAPNLEQGHGSTWSRDMPSLATSLRLDGGEV